MIIVDWLTIEIALKHLPLSQGHKMIIDEFGELKSDFALFRSVENSEGSWSSKVQVYSTSTSFCNKFFNDCDIGEVTTLVISGNPQKFLQGHNCFSTASLSTLVLEMTKKVMKKLNFSDHLILEAIRSIKSDKYKITRIDITKMFNVGVSQADVQSYINQLQFSLDTRGNRVELTKNTCYVGKSSGLWSLKFYSKYLEINSSKRHRLPVEFPRDEFNDFLKNQLRVELVLRKQQIDRLFLNNNQLHSFTENSVKKYPMANFSLKPSDIERNLNKIYEFFMNKISINDNSTINVPLSSIEKNFQKAFLLWKSGENLKFHYSKSQYYHYLKYFRDVHNLNLKKPFVPHNKKLCIVKPLKVLEPVSVNQIPANLRKYTLKQRIAS